jgi:hypothetical protein
LRSDRAGIREDTRDVTRGWLPLQLARTLGSRVVVKRSEELEKEIFEALKKHEFERVEALKEEDRNLGSLMPVYTHSFGDSDRSPLVYLHNQILVDLRTVSAIIRAVLLPGGPLP